MTILPVYQQVLAELAKRGIDWVQIDEPALVLELPPAWLEAFQPAYDALQGQVKLLLTTYFEGVTPNLATIAALPFRGCTSIWCTAKMMLPNCTSACRPTGCCPRVLINGRNVWRADLTENMRKLKTLSANAIYGSRHPALCCTAPSI